MDRILFLARAFMPAARMEAEKIILVPRALGEWTPDKSTTCP